MTGYPFIWADKFFSHHMIIVTNNLINTILLETAVLKSYTLALCCLGHWLLMHLHSELVAY